MSTPLVARAPALSAGDTARLHEILGDPNVVGCGPGVRQRGGKWTDEPCLTIYVRRKLRAGELAGGAENTRPLPRRLGDHEIDVIEVGVFTANVSHLSVFAAGGYSGFGATALAESGGSPLVLLSGHAVLPRGAGGSPIARWSPGHGGEVRVAGYAGPIVGGAVGAGLGVDWALARLSGVTVNRRHHLTNTMTPLAYTGVLYPGEDVIFASPARQQRSYGLVRGYTSHLTIGGVVYSGLVLVESATPGQPFSVHNDSGSLIFNRANEAIGTIVGASNTTPVSAIATISALLGDPDFSPFGGDFFQ